MANSNIDERCRSSEGSLYNINEQSQNRGTAAGDVGVSKGTSNSDQQTSNVENERNSGEIEKSNEGSFAYEKSNKYRDTTRANKLLKEKNEKIRSLEADLRKVTSEEAKGVLQTQINEIENDYNTKIQKLYDNINETNTLNSQNKGSNRDVLGQSNKIIGQEQKNVDMGQINENKRNYLMSAQKYNIDINNKTVTSIYEIAERRGVQTMFDETVFSNSSENAIWRMNEDGSREVILNPKADTNQTLQSVMIHELTHDFEGSQEYNVLYEMALEKMQRQEGFEEAIKSLQETYAKVYDSNSKEFNNLIIFIIFL